jgi:hypothetical protein
VELEDKKHLPGGSFPIVFTGRDADDVGAEASCDTDNLRANAPETVIDRQSDHVKIEEVAGKGVKWMARIACQTGNGRGWPCGRIRLRLRCTDEELFQK